MPSALPLESRRPARGHEPVLADEVARMLALRPGETVVDCTFGAGGHARRLAPALGEGGRYIAIDQDPEAGDWFAVLVDGADEERAVARVGVLSLSRGSEPS